MPNYPKQVIGKSNVSDLHPLSTPLFIAAALRGYRLHFTSDGQLYRLVEVRGEIECVLADRATFREVANLCGATGNTTLREAAERDGLRWPTSAESFIEVVKRI